MKLKLILIWTATWQTQQNECAPIEDSDQPGHPPSLIRDFAVRMKKAWVLCYPLSAQRRLWSDWADAQADLSLRWARSHFVCFVMLWLIWFTYIRRLILQDSTNIPPIDLWASKGPSHEIMALFVLRKFILGTRMYSYPDGLDIWFLVGLFVYFHIACVRTAKALALAWAFADRLCDKVP